jgi:hypothetical protein
MKEIKDMSKEEIYEEYKKYEEERKEYVRVNFVRRKDYEERLKRGEDISKVNKLNELMREVEEKKDDVWKKMNEVRERREEEILIEKVLKMYVRGEISEEELKKLEE